MARKRMKNKLDKKVFSHTAVKGKKLNVLPRSHRSGSPL